MGRLRRRASIARKGIIQILETAAEYNFEGEEWVNLRRDSRNLTQALKKIERLEELALGVESLERRQREGRERLENLLAALASAVPEAVKRPRFTTVRIPGRWATTSATVSAATNTMSPPQPGVRP